ncbi:MAG: hypothetical protein ACRECA_08420, partial [Pseudolabrys sp.]
FGARPFAYEISIATHLMQKNFDVEFADYAGTGRFDFLARLGQAEIEVECKSTSSDTGRKIHRQEVNRLTDLILPTTQQLAGARGCHLIRITIPNRLGKANEHLVHIASLVSAASGNKRSTASDLASVEYTFEDLRTWPEPGRDLEAREFFESRFGLTNAYMLFSGRSGFSIVAVAIASDKADSVVDALSEAAKEAADQCTGSRPALIALHLIDQIDRAELATMLKTANGMHAIAGSVFNSSKRSHVDSIAFTIPQVQQFISDRSMRLSAPVLILNNPSPQFRCDTVRQIFR